MNINGKPPLYQEKEAGIQDLSKGELGSRPYGIYYLILQKCR